MKGRGRRMFSGIGLRSQSSFTSMPHVKSVQHFQKKSTGGTGRLHRLICTTGGCRYRMRHHRHHR